MTFAPPKGLIILLFSFISKLYSFTSDCVIKLISDAVSIIVLISVWLLLLGIELSECECESGLLMYKFIKSLRLFDLMLFCSILNDSGVDEQQLHPSTEQPKRSGGR